MSIPILLHRVQERQHGIRAAITLSRESSCVLRMADTPSVPRTEDRRHRVAPNPMSRALIGNRKSPAPGAGRVALTVASISNGTSSGDHYNSGRQRECSLQCDLHVGSNNDLSNQNFGSDTANRSRSFVRGGACSSNASSCYLRRRNSRSRASLRDGLMQRAPRFRFAYSYDVAWPGRDGGEQPVVISHGASGFRAPSINAQVVSHEIVLAQPQNVPKVSLASDAN